MAGWKLSTFFFAGATFFFLGLEVLRPEPATVRAPPRVVTVVETPPERPAAAPLLPPFSPEPRPSAAPSAANELAYSSLILGEPRQGWDQCIALLEPRRDDVLPVLEDWIARAEEIYAAGGSLNRALIAYAKLKGKEAVPALERLAVEQNHAGRDAAQALLWIEDPDATQAILRLQARQTPGTTVFSTFELMKATKAAADAVRAWESDPALRAYARQALFVLGNDGESERVWQSADRGEQRVLLRAYRYVRYTRPVGRAVAEAATQFLTSEDPQDREAALGVILRAPDAFPPATVAAADKTLSDLVATPPPGMRKVLKNLNDEWQARRKADELNERIRAVLLR
jgi:hypothetical protein